MNDKSSAEDVAEFVARLAEKEYKIDAKLLELWSDLPSEHRVQFKAAKYEFNFVFSALQRLLQSQVQVLSIITATLKRDQDSASAALKEYSDTVLLATNDVRRFMTAIMQDATGANLDDEARVIESASHDG